MLVNGRFIKETKPTIGKFYVKPFNPKDYTPEERFAQSLILGFTEKKNSLPSKFLGYLLRI
jgi:hypothetical protein